MTREAGEPPKPPGESPFGRRRKLTLGEALVRWSRIVLSEPSKSIALFWLASAVLMGAVMLILRLNLHRLDLVLGVTALFTAAGAIRLVTGRSLPAWALNVDVALGTLLITILTTVGLDQRIPFSALYVWVGIFVGMYFRPLVAATHVAFAGVLYAVALLSSPVAGSPAAAWMIVIGTAALAGAVTSGLVGALRLEAREDPVTGLANRRCFDERLEEELQRARRGGTQLSLVVMDLDEFKSVNDRFGHDEGDLLLARVAAAWSAALREGGDFVARLGGDEFAVIAPGSDAQGVRRLADRLQQVLPYDVSCSMGVATWDGREETGSMLRRADQAMYRAKQGRQRPGGED